MNILKKTLLMALMMPFIMFAQNANISSDYTVTSGTPYRVVDAPSKEYISHENGFVYMAKMKTEFVTIQKYDVDGMKEVSKNEYDDFPKYSKFQEFIQLKGRIFLIYEAFNKKEDTFTLYAREVNTDDGTLDEQQALLTSSRPVKNSDIPVDMSNIKSHNALTQQGYKFLVEKSQDESKILVHYTLKQLSKRDKENYDEIGFYAFDGALNKLWGTEVKMPYTEANMDNVCYAVTNAGEAKMIINNYSTDNYELFSVNQNEELEVIKTNLSNDRLVREFRLKEDPSGNLIGVGFYANGIEYKVSFMGTGTLELNINGLLYFAMSNDGEILEEKTFDFSEEFIQQNLSDRQKKAVAKREKDGKAGISDLNLTDFVVKEDGSTYCIGEVQFIEVTTYYTSSGSRRTKKTYRYGNVIALKINKDRELEWMKKLPKNQSGSARLGQMSISHLETENGDYVAFIDNLKNIDLNANDGIPAKHINGKGGFLTTYKIGDERGDLEKHTLLDLKEVPGGHKAYQFNTSRIISCGNGDFLLEIYIKGKEDTMVKFHAN